MTTCEIIFDQNEHGTYFTGQLVSGRVVIGFTKKKKLRGIQLKICGYASASWFDRRSGRRREHHHKKRKFTGREDYIASNTYLIGSENGHEVTVDAGTHTFTFQCFIPENCPSSFEGSYGHIRYVAKAIMINSFSKNHTYTVGFTVLKLLDLNRESHLLKMPANSETMQGFCLSTAKPVFLSVDITQTGYVPGQMILVSGDVNNQSNCDAKKVYVFLNLRATYTADCPRLNMKTEKICLVKKKSNPVPRKTQRNFTEIIRVPATAPTCEHLSKIVRISYEIAVVAVMNGLIKNAKTVIPITIGNVPIQTQVMQTVPVSQPVDVPSTSASSAVQNEYIEVVPTIIQKDLPPPTYEEAMFMSTNNVDDEVQSPNEINESIPFAPRYPVFDVDGILVPQSVQPAQLQELPVTEKQPVDDVKYLI